MNCREIQDLFGDAIDGSLADRVRQTLTGHLSRCAICKREFELESATRVAIRNRVKAVAAPADARRTVLQALQVEYARPPGLSDRLDRVLGVRRWAPAASLGFALLLLVYLFLPRNPDTRLVHAASNDVMFQALENFRLVRDGAMKPSLTSCSPESVAGFFNKRGVTFTVNIRPMDECDWYGATSNEYGGVKLAHVVYKIGEDVLYVYQVRVEDTEEGAPLTVSATAREALNRSGWFTDPEHPDHYVVLWQEGGTLCAAASTMNKEKMLALLASR